MARPSSQGNGEGALSAPKSAAEVDAQLDRIEATLARLIATLRRDSEMRRAEMKWWMYE